VLLEFESLVEQIVQLRRALGSVSRSSGGGKSGAVLGMLDGKSSLVLRLLDREGSLVPWLVQRGLVLMSRLKLMS